MSTEKFELFGEPLPETGLGKPERPKAESAILSAVGRYVFWLLVVVIVFTRITYFSSVPSYSPHVVSALIHNAVR
jgi:hypothetical protein